MTKKDLSLHFRVRLPEPGSLASLSDSTIALVPSCDVHDSIREIQLG